MQNIQSIVFDLGNVIINLKQENTWWEEDVFPYFDAANIKQLMGKGLFLDYETGVLDDDTFRRELHMTRKYDSDLNVVDNAWNALLLDIPPERIQLLEKLSMKYDLYLLSNTNNIHLTYIRNLSNSALGFDLFQQFFTACFFSHEMGLRKPDKAIYESAWLQAGISPAHSLFLDDKIENLTYPAAMGIHCLHIDPSNGFENTLPDLLNK